MGLWPSVSLGTGAGPGMAIYVVWRIVDAIPLSVAMLFKFAKAPLLEFMPSA